MAEAHQTNCLSDGSWLQADPADLCRQCTRRKLSQCSLLKPEMTKDLRVLAARENYAKGDVIFAERTPAKKVFVVVSGLIRRVKHMQSGRRYVASFVGPGEIMGVVSDEVHEFGAEAIVPSEVCSFSRDAFHAVLESDDDVKRQLLEFFSTELIETHIHSLVLAQETAKSRFAAFLQVMRAKEIRRTGQGDCVTLPMKRQDIADYLGLAHETVSRSIHQLEREGAIRLEGFSKIWINEIEGYSDISTDVLEHARAVHDEAEAGA